MPLHLRSLNLTRQRTDLQISSLVSNKLATPTSDHAPMLCAVDDFSRVKLEIVDGREGSDYINASYIDVSVTFVTLRSRLYVYGVVGIQASQCIHRSTRPHAKHNRRLLEDDLGEEIDCSCHAHQDQ